MYINTLLVWTQSRKLLSFTLIALMTLPISGLRGQSTFNFTESKLIIESNLKNYEKHWEKRALSNQTPEKVT